MKLKRKFPWAAIVALALLCGVAGAAYAKSEGMQRFKPVPRVIFKLVMITEPSVPDGFVAWQDYLRERCTVKFGGKLIVQAGGGTYQETVRSKRIKIQTVTVTCEGTIYGA